jgi:hypothetical protein
MNKYLAGLVILLALAAAYFVWVEPGEDVTKLPDRAFKVDSEDQIHKVFIAQRDGDSFTLERDGKDWIVNGKYKAMTGSIRNLLFTLTNMEIEYIPPRAAMPSITKDLATLGVKVEVYNKSGERIRNFYVGGTDPGARSTYMVVEGEEQPYAMYVPTWEGNLRERFLLKLKDWRDRTVIAYEPDEIKSVKVNYPRASAASFILERDDAGDFFVRRLDRIDQSEQRDVVSGAVQYFLIGLEKIGAESFESDNPYRAEIENYVPYFELEVNTLDGAQNQLKIWPFNHIEEKIDYSEEFMQKEPFRFFGATNDGELYMLQRPNLEKLLVTYDYFFQVPRN